MATLTMRMKGFLDDAFRFPDLPSAEAESIVVDWDNVPYINSASLLKWLRWTAEVRKARPDVSFVFVNCPHFLPPLMNSVKGFLPTNSSVSSCQVPVTCSKCRPNEAEHAVLATFDLDSGTSVSEDGLLNRLRFQHCKGASPCAMELDVAPNYFNFLKRR